MHSDESDDHYGRLMGMATGVLKSQLNDEPALEAILEKKDWLGYLRKVGS